MSAVRKMIIASLLGVVMSQPAFAQQRVDVQVAKSCVLKLGDIRKISVADPAIADIAVLSRRDLLVNGKSPGATTVIVWTKDQRLTYDVVVKPDVDQLRTALRKALGVKDANDIGIEVVGKRVILTGKAENSSQIELATKISQGFYENVVNLIAEENAQQIEVDVQVVEMSKKNGHDNGVNWGSLRITPSGEAVYLPNLLTFAGNAAGSALSFAQFDRLAAQLKLLENQGVAKILANPKLVTVNGGKATFLAGGQIPVPEAQQLGQITIAWRDYGVKLAIEPRIKPNGRIDLKLKPEVSALDYTNALRINGFLVPSLTTRQAETEVLLAPGQGLAIGGLLQNTESKSIEKLPVLGNIPVLGALFRSESFQKDETELTILVIPRLVSSRQDIATTSASIQ